MKRMQEEGGEEEGVRKNRYGDGGSWVRGPMVGKGSFGSVFMANLRNPRSRYCCFPPVMAVKSAEVSVSGTLQKEKEVLINVQGCPNVVKCFGEEITMGVNGGGEMVYNILLEYASGGTLATLIKNHPPPSSLLPEADVRRYTRSILRGLNHIHQRGYVHCDLKLENILLVPSNGKLLAKISDFGSAKRMIGQRKKMMIMGRLNNRTRLRGTALYMSPEAVGEGIQESPCDIWALGCVGLEMLTGKPPWDHRKKDDYGGKSRLISAIGSGLELAGGHLRTR